MREVGSDARSVDDIVQSELVNERGSLEKERERLHQNKSATKGRLDSSGLTWPIPPEAPATTAMVSLQAQRGSHGSWSCPTCFHHFAGM